MAKTIGIDLGTTNSCVAVLERGEPVVIPNAEGSRTTPSMVAFNDRGERLIGQVAKRQAITNPERTFYAIKRLIGRKFDSPEAKKSTEICSFKIVPSKNNDAWVQYGDKMLSPPEISAIILQKMKETAEEYLGEEVTDAIITSAPPTSTTANAKPPKMRGDCGTQRPSNHQRADRGRPRVWARQEKKWDCRRFRSRWGNVRRIDSRDFSRRVSRKVNLR